MRMVDLIIKKRNGGILTGDEIKFLIHGVTDGSIPDEQISAFLMAVCIRGMTKEETVAFTVAMAHSGEMVDLSFVNEITVDKHSTGGVGDKTTLVVAPIVAACGVTMVKMSGRGLGHTGGTVDKLTAIPGLKMELTENEFKRIITQHSLCVASQSGDLAPADKKLYALRDVTGTIESLPLIAASIMSKKLAAGADCIVLDVKAGSGAFMKTTEAATELARAMVNIGNGAGRKTTALITDMDRPLGYAIGNSLEVIESAETLKGRGPEDLHEICVVLAAHLLHMAGKGTFADCRRMAELTITDGTAFEKLNDMVTAQGGDGTALSDYTRLPHAVIHHPITANRTGYIAGMDTMGWGNASVMLGAGRVRKEDPIDYGAGILLHKKTGDYVEAGETIAVLYTNDEKSVREAVLTAMDAVTIENEKPENVPLVLDIIQ